MNSEPKLPHFAAALKLPGIRLFILSVGFFTLASRALMAVIGFQIYKITHTPLALGWLGLVEAVPAISLVLFGGYVADHYNRHRILLITGASLCLCAISLALLSWEAHSTNIAALYIIIFIAGVARGFMEPAVTAFEAQIVPKNLTVNAGSWISSTWISCSILGSAVIGFIFHAGGAASSYIFIAVFFVLSWLCLLNIPHQPQAMPDRTDPILKSMASGWHYLFSHQPLLAALALDLFAVLFGGTMALLPIYATDILNVGSRGFGFLNAAPSMGALIISLIATRHPPMKNAGRNLFLTVTGFGLSILVFAFSKNFWISITALFVSGLFDGVSVVIRRSMIRLLSPENMRGRVAAASWIFICASNELGAFESGMVAAWIGTIPCVAAGSLVTLGVVALTAFLAPELRRLRFNVRTMERES